MRRAAAPSAQEEHPSGSSRRGGSRYQRQTSIERGDGLDSFSIKALVLGTFVFMVFMSGVLVGMRFSSAFAEEQVLHRVTVSMICDSPVFV